MKWKQKIYDFEDFAEAIGSSCKGNVDLKKMNVKEFFKWKDLSSAPKLNQKATNRPYLSDIVQVVAERGKFTLKYKTSFSGQENTLDFLMKKFMKKSALTGKLETLHEPHGFPNDKKEMLLKVIGPIFPENRKSFWKNLPILNSEETEQWETIFYLSSK